MSWAAAHVRLPLEVFQARSTGKQHGVEPEYAGETSWAMIPPHTAASMNRNVTSNSFNSPNHQISNITNTPFRMQHGSSSSWISSILSRKLDIHVRLGVFVALYSPVWRHMQTDTAACRQLQCLISPNSLWQSPWLVLHSSHNEHICLLAGEALILCNVTQCQLREGLLWKVPACSCCGTTESNTWWIWSGESSDSRQTEAASEEASFYAYA